MIISIPNSFLQFSANNSGNTGNGNTGNNISNTGPTFPRIGAILVGENGSANSPRAYTSPIANYDYLSTKVSVIAMQHYSGLREQITGNTKAAIDSALKKGKLAGSNTPYTFDYMNYGEQKKADFTTSGAVWDIANEISTNDRYVYVQGTSGQIANSWFSYPNYYKLNYTTLAPVVAGKKWFEWRVDREVGVMRNGATTQSSATTTATQPANPYKDGCFIDNFFWREIPNSGNGSGDPEDWNRDGTSDDNNSTVTQQLIRNSHKAVVARLRANWPGVKICGNWGDITSRAIVQDGLTTLAGTEYDQLIEACLMETLFGKTFSIEYYNSFKSCLVGYNAFMDALLPPKLCIIGNAYGVANGYALLRYTTTFTCLNDGYIANQDQGNYNTDGMVKLDEFYFNLGYPIDARQTTARYQANTTDGSGVYRRDFDNGVVLCGARRGIGNVLAVGDQTTAYTSITLPFDVWRLNANALPFHQDTITNSGAKIAAGNTISIKPRDGLILSKSPT